MRRGISLILVICLMTGLLCGCWDYQSTGRLDIVAGIAIDKDKESGSYKLLLEIVDINAISQEGKESKTIYIESEGHTLSEALKDTNKRIYSKLFLSNMQTLVLNKEIAETEGIYDIIEHVLTDMNVREAINIIISDEDTAAEILTSTGLDTSIVSFEINEIVRSYQKDHAIMRSVTLYQAYMGLKEPGRCVLLPIFKNVENNGELTPVFSSMAYFKGDTLDGTLSLDEVMYYVLLTDGPKELVITVPSAGEPQYNNSFGINSCKSNCDVQYKDGRLYLSATIQLDVSPETLHYLQSGTTEGMDKLTQQLKEQVDKDIRALVSRIQKEAGYDIFGFAAMLYQRDYDLYLILKDNWDELFQNAEFDVDVYVEINSTGVIIQE